MSIVVSSNYSASGTNYSYQTADDDLISGFRPIGQAVEEHDHTTTRGLGPQDDRVYSFGTGRDVASVLRSTSLAANTTLTNVITGTPVVTAPPADTIIHSHITASGDMLWLMNDGAGNSWEYLRFDGSADFIVFNEASNDIDFRIEGNGNANMFVIDAGTDSMGLGGALDAASFLTIDNVWAPGAGPAALIYSPADVTGVLNTNIHLLRFEGNTLAEASSGTHARISVIDITAPTITDNAAGATNTAIVYISNAMSTTVTGRNKALWVDAGVSEFGGNVTPDANDAAALGTTALGWADLFLAEGGVINWDDGDLTLTQTNNVLALAGGTLDMSNNIISNIGAAGTDFTATGGLTLADTLTVTAGNLVMTVGDIIVITAASIRLDGNASGNTYIREESADVVAITAGGTVAARFNVGSVTITSGLTVTAGGATITAGNLGIGAAGADAGIGAYIATTTLTGTTQTGVHSRVTFSSAATVAGNAILAQVRTAAAAYTMTNAYGAFVDNANIGAASAITNLYGIYITAQSGASTLNIGLYNAGTTTLVGNTDLGVAGATLGVLKFNGNTSGTITVQSAAAAGTWTFTLPPDDGDAGEQLQTNGSGVTTWEAAASERKYKLLGAMPTPQWGLEAILRMPIHSFHYDPKSGKAKDFATEYYGVVADEAPLVMHWGGTIFNEISAFGLTTLAIQRHEQRIAQLEAENRELRQLVEAT